MNAEPGFYIAMSVTLPCGHTLYATRIMPHSHFGFPLNTRHNVQPLLFEYGNKVARELSAQVDHACPQCIGSVALNLNATQEQAT